MKRKRGMVFGGLLIRKDPHSAMPKGAGRWLPMFILITLCVSGCVVFPYAPKPDTPALVGQKLDPEGLCFITPGSTTRENLVATLGQPSIELSGFQMVAYHWIAVKRNWFWFIGSAGGAAGGIVRQPGRNTLLIAMDKDDHVLAWGVDEQKRSDRASTVAQARRWAEANGVPVSPKQLTYSAPTVPQGQALIIAYRKKLPFSWMHPSSPEPISIALNDRFCAELSDGEYVVLPVSPGGCRILAHPAAPYRYWAGDPDCGAKPGIRTSDIALEVSSNKIYFLEMQSSIFEGYSKIISSIFIRPEVEAIPALMDGTGIW